MDEINKASICAYSLYTYIEALLKYIYYDIIYKFQKNKSIIVYIIRGIVCMY